METNVPIGVTEISPRAVQQVAERNYKAGYYCCESLMYTMKKELKLDVPDAVIAMSSGMAVGAGPTNPRSIKSMELTHELHDWFRANNGKNALCCRVLTREFDMGAGEHKEQCIYFTGLCAWKLTQMLCRECGIKNIDEIDEPCARRALADV